MIKQLPPLSRPSLARRWKNAAVVRPSAHRYHMAQSKDGVAKISLKGSELLQDSLWNKGTAFTREERKAFAINGYLPHQVHTLKEQQDRAWQQFQSRPDNISKNIFLTSLRDQNQVLYFSLLAKHIKEVMPVIYTPTEGEAIANYSRLFRRPEGLFLALPGQESMQEDLLNYVHDQDRKNEDVDLIIVSDGEQILGIGDQGVGAIGISTAKAAVYTVCAGIDPARVISVGLDVGTNNQEMLDDPLYVGWRNKRVTGKEYDNFVDRFAELVKKHFPNALLHFEDFGTANALRLLEKYRPKQSVFNDDIQGTAAVTLATILAACKCTNTQLLEHRFVVFGAGTAGVGIAKQIRSAIQHLDDENMSEEKATKLFWLVDKDGLITEGLDSIREAQKPYARSKSEIDQWQVDDKSKISLLDVVKNVAPTVLIGVSTQPGAFTEEIVRTMSKHAEHPIILPLSNPTKLHECKPADAFEWSDGKALLATGSPFPPIEIKGSKDKYIVAECNNATCYPGLALGVIASKASKLSDGMIVAGIDALAKLAPAYTDGKLTSALLPAFEEARSVSVKVATAVAMKAQEEGLAREEALKGRAADEAEAFVKSKMWVAEYRKLEYVPR